MTDVITVYTLPKSKDDENDAIKIVLSMSDGTSIPKFMSFDGKKLQMLPGL